jgi:hypothetical protein
LALKVAVEQVAVICAGNSHLAAISRAAEKQHKRLIEFRLKDIRKADKAHQPDLNRRLMLDMRSAIEAENVQHVFCFVGGGTPAILGLVQHPEPFDFTIPDRSDLPVMPHAEAIPFDAVSEMMGRILQRHFRQLRRLAKLSAKLVQIETPPPVPDSEYLLAHASAYEDAAALGISPLHLRYKLWYLHSRLFEEFCGEADIEYLRNPDEIFDKDGFLKRRYWGDVVHGNEEYGAVILERIEQYKQ